MQQAGQIQYELANDEATGGPILYAYLPENVTISDVDVLFGSKPGTLQIYVEHNQSGQMGCIELEGYCLAQTDHIKHSKKHNRFTIRLNKLGAGPAAKAAKPAASSNGAPAVPAASTTSNQYNLLEDDDVSDGGDGTPDEGAAGGAGGEGGKKKKKKKKKKAGAGAAASAAGDGEAAAAATDSAALPAAAAAPAPAPAAANGNDSGAAAAEAEAADAGDSGDDAAEGGAAEGGGEGGAKKKKKKKNKKKKAGEGGEGGDGGGASIGAEAAADDAAAPAAPAAPQSPPPTNPKPRATTDDASPEGAAPAAAGPSHPPKKGPITVDMQSDFPAERFARCALGAAGSGLSAADKARHEALHGPYLHVGLGKVEVKGEDKLMESPANSWSVEGQLGTFATSVSAFGIFDGHGGRQAATFASKQLLQHLAGMSERAVGSPLPSSLEELAQGGFLPPAPEALEGEEEQERRQATGRVYAAQDALLERLPKALHAAFVNADAECLSRHKTSGSTATLAVQVGWELLIANVGDSLAYLDTGSEIVMVSGNHRVSESPEEQQRIIEAGGRVNPSVVDCEGEVAEAGGTASQRQQQQPAAGAKGPRTTGSLRMWPGGLMMSRTIGDYEAREVKSCEPAVRQISLPVTGARLVLASDGLWDAVNAKSIIGQLRTATAKEAATRAAATAVKATGKGQSDDVTVLVIDFVPRACDAKAPALVAAKKSVAKGEGVQLWRPLETPSTTWRERHRAHRAAAAPYVAELDSHDKAMAAAEAAANARISGAAASSGGGAAAAGSSRAAAPLSATYRELAELRLDPTMLDDESEEEEKEAEKAEWTDVQVKKKPSASKDSGFDFTAQLMRAARPGPVKEQRQEGGARDGGGDAEQHADGEGGGRRERRPRGSRGGRGGRGGGGGFGAAAANGGPPHDGEGSHEPHRAAAAAAAAATEALAEASAPAAEPANGRGGGEGRGGRGGGEGRGGRGRGGGERRQSGPAPLPKQGGQALQPQPQPAAPAAAGAGEVVRQGDVLLVPRSMLNYSDKPPRGPPSGRPERRERKPPPPADAAAPADPAAGADSNGAGGGRRGGADGGRRRERGPRGGGSAAAQVQGMMGQEPQFAPSMAHPSAPAAPPAPPAHLLAQAAGGQAPPPQRPAHTHQAQAGAVSPQLAFGGGGFDSGFGAEFERQPAAVPVAGAAPAAPAPQHASAGRGPHEGRGGGGGRGGGRGGGGRGRGRDGPRAPNA